MRRSPVRPLFLTALTLSLATANVSTADLPGSAREGGAGARGLFSYRIEPLSNMTQSHPVIDHDGPYYFFLLTNNGAVSDTYSMEVQNLSASPTDDWFPQVCIGLACFPVSTTISLSPGESDTVGVNVVPESDGVGTWDYYLESQGDPGLNDLFPGMELYAGTFATDANKPFVERLDGYLLQQNSPNPARAGTRISFSLPRDDLVALRVYDVSGRLIRTLTEGPLPAGSHDVVWQGRDDLGRDRAGGVYFYRLDTSSGALTKQLTLLR